ncbi:sporulation protein YqfD [Tissierella creatinophila]|uniref:Putative stage IV sporulation protein YqfD n=1 Tax=Tissierella creatinophila DSM 6911 TaxID=1123403 RepID=A0A1U7M7W7_TISCR|nr:sporulation protein YqfD [Tissierella creatinophila]OLS03375.1 putative stage IV sporulation protein YqfD [Tissierella creatinophila DSM 6911]
MLAIKIWNYLKGYVIIRIKGLSLERLLNLCLVNDIYLWNVDRINNVEIEASISILGYNDLEELVNKVGCRVEIKERVGFPFFLDRFKKRKSLGIGAIIFFVLFGVLSSIIWKIDIIGLQQIPHEEIIKELNRDGIKIGNFKKNIDEDSVQKKILEEFKYISYIQVKKKGVKLIIEIKEEDMPMEDNYNQYPSNIVAKRKGVIFKVIAKKGKAIAQKGQIVKENDLLISGTVDSEITEETGLVSAKGEVLAYTTYSDTVESPIIIKEKRETGNKFTQRGIKLKKKRVKFFSSDIPYKDYIQEIEEKSILGLNNIDIPVKWVEYIYKEVEVEEVKRDVDALKKSSQIKAIENINKELAKKSEIISKNAVFTIKDNILTTKVIIETIEDIGKVKIIKK